MIQEKMDGAIQNNDKETMAEQIELHKKIVECFRLFKNVYGPVYFSRFVFTSLGIAVAGFEVTVVSFHYAKFLKSI